MDELLRVFLRIGVLSFGGPTAQIALMHRELVDQRNWMTEEEYLSALSFCMLLPGPEAMQLATYVGWKRQGVPGGLLAGLLFVLPGAVVVLALAGAYAVWGQAPFTEALFLGVKACVVIIVIEALLRVAKRALKSTDRWVIAALAFVAIFALHLPFPLIILAAGLYGAATAQGVAAPAGPAPRGAHTARTVAVWLAIWWAPVLAAWAAGATLLTDIGLFFSKLAVVTFGGAYSVLAYMAQEAVQAKGWLSAEAMMDGLGLAETTPGPLILVTEFVGYLAGFAQGGWPLAVAAAAMTLWVTFAPCFLWIFAGAPWLDRITARPRLKGALSAITAAVVGVILNLTVWFGLHVFFGTVTDRSLGPVTLPVPDPATLDWRPVVLAVLAGGLLLRLHRGLFQTLAVSAVAGLVLAQVG
jgi:chromate transporter